MKKSEKCTLNLVFYIHLCTERKYWSTASLLKFFEHGHELHGDPHMIYLTVENIPDDLVETDQTEQSERDGAGSKRKVGMKCYVKNKSGSVVTRITCDSTSTHLF